MHVHISALDAVVTVLEVLVIMGILNWIAMKYKDTSSFWASYANLYGLDS
jgi:hypothetical protein